ncbi:MAG: hypothetical protein L3J56_07360 [Bacteroidales bacterium]|nr:hypothetical protein [Bacteroidales bacterium]
MKKTKKHYGLFVLLALVLIFSSCRKNNNSITEEEFLTVKVDGIEITLTSAVITVPASKDYYTMIAVGDNEMIQFHSLGELKVGTITNVRDTTIYMYSVDSKSWISDGILLDGSFTVTKITDNYAEGTFHFKGLYNLDSSYKVLTDGKFKAAIKPL